MLRIKLKSLNTILIETKNKPSNYEGVNHKLLVKKDAKFTYRTIDIASPYLCYLLVRQMTTSDNWKEIKDRFTTFISPNIEVISIPKVKSDKDKSHKAAGISDWLEKVEQKNLALKSSGVNKSKLTRTENC